MLQLSWLIVLPLSTSVIERFFQKESGGRHGYPHGFVAYYFNILNIFGGQKTFIFNYLHL